MVKILSVTVKIFTAVVNLFSPVFCSIFWLAILLLVSSNSIQKKIESSNRTEDSVQIVGLLQQVYEWHHNHQNEQPDFPIIVADTIQNDINFEAHNKTFVAIQQSNFFSKTFLKNYQNIAEQLHLKLSTANPKYLNEINFAYQDQDPWTNSQEVVDNYWKQLLISDLVIDNTQASLCWKIQNENLNTNKYTVKLEKVNGVWKVAYLQGFDLAQY